jgi:hypothetical protein
MVASLHKVYRLNIYCNQRSRDYLKNETPYAHRRRRKDEPTLPNFRVTLTRTVTQTHDLDIEADDKEQAESEGDAEATNIADEDWLDDDLQSDPEVTKVVELSESGDEFVEEAEE